jgi:nucleoside-diphosphate-sugar epimerase
MPSSLPPSRSTRTRRPSLLIVGCGDVGLRVLRQLQGRWRVLVLNRTPDRRELLRAAGAMPLQGDLDDAGTLGRLAALADAVLHLAPPPAKGVTDARTHALMRALARAGRVRRIVYASTTGVYGDCGGAWIDETRPLRPATDRARRRADAEALVRHFGRTSGARVTILRVPGIYAFDRDGGDPRDRVRRGTPALVAAHDVYTNHIHADDLARACVLALHRGPNQRAIHVNDDSTLRAGEHFDRVALLAGLPPVPRLTREQAARELSPMQFSFLGESRRLLNRRLKRELRLQLRYPSVDDAFRRLASA